MSKNRYLKVNSYMLKGPLKLKGYDWWWHSFTGYHKETGEARAFFVEYFVINPGISPEAPLFGQTPLSGKPSYCMIKAGTWGKDGAQLHNFYPVSEVSFTKNDGAGLMVEGAGGIQNTCSETLISGSVSVTPTERDGHPEWMSDAGAMSWSLQVSKKVAYNPGYGTSWLFRKLNAFQMYWHAQGVKTEYTGTVVFNGEEYVVPGEKSWGYADKNWGSGFTSPWLWLSSCCLTSNISGQRLTNSCFDVGGGCPRVFGIPLKRRILVFFWYEGRKIEYNFSHFWVKSKVTFRFEEETNRLHWTVAAENRKYLLDIDAFCPSMEALFANYEDPLGKKRFDRLWNGGTGYGELKLFKKARGKTLELIENARFSHAGCEYGEFANE